MNKSEQILVVDDDPAMRSLMSFRLEGLGYQVALCDTGEMAVEQLREDFPYDLVLLDMMLPGINGVEVLKDIKREHSQCQVVMITGYPSLKLGVEAIKNGAFDFVCKPFDIEQLLKIVGNALENLQLRQENQVLRQSMRRPTGFSDMIGQSAKMKQVRDLIRQSAISRATVLILGESGTGKEVVAQTVHRNSPLHQGPFVTVNCGAIPETLIESELFGYEKGAFTGALRQTKGKFEQAHNGTIFLDEIGELPLQAQVKLLRVLQEKEVVRLGGDEAIKVNFRVIAATNRNLTEEVRAGNFREDLYYRLALFVITIPPLRERGNDILLLAQHFLEKYSALEERPPIGLEPSAETFLKTQPWSGNVRQLENCIYRTVLMAAEKSTLSQQDIQFLPDVGKPEVATNESSLLQGKPRPFSEIEAQAISETLEFTRGNISEASKHLKIARGTLYRKIQEYQLGHLTESKALNN